MHQTCRKTISSSDYEYSKLGNGLLWKKFNKEYNIIRELGVKSRPFFCGAFSTIILPATPHFESVMELDLMGTYVTERDAVYEF